jgi:GNAT superfamily N-acetyltransferase
VAGVLEDLVIRPLDETDPGPIAVAFAAIGWDKPESQYRQYLAQQRDGRRCVLVATMADHFAGYLTVVWSSSYPPFAAAGIPEIADFNVLPAYRRRGIGGALMDAGEALVGRRSAVVGIGVGLYADYGSAQRMYVRRGYLPDGRGVMYDGVPVRPGEGIRLDDAATLMFTKRLPERSSELPCNLSGMSYMYGDRGTPASARRAAAGGARVED